jgi:hypothetical protein
MKYSIRLLSIILIFGFSTACDYSDLLNQVSPCGDGSISEPCNCGGEIHTSGVCCENVWSQVASCPVKFWSIGSYTGWADWSPEDVDYSPFTHIMHFAMLPDAVGNLEEGYTGTSEEITQVVDEAHAHGIPVILVIGSEGEGPDFVTATSNENREHFVQEIVDAVVSNGYDGASVDWEEEVVGHEQQLINLVRELRTALDQVDPSLILMLDVISGLVPPSLAAEVVEDVDTINIMSYWDNGIDEVNVYTEAGVPAEKIILGIGLSWDYFDLTTEHVVEKIQTVRDYGLRGVESWAFHDIESWDDPRLVPLLEAVEGQ